ncbi:sigma-70 family RNA polymerase sigma factor [Pigmentiphaga aceris]|uniref:Sigma-70 family RNA polymerase sigma factor n=1 Tax=Pigmentiphaga aceris TaxID=1940612 RepID=A0A5C0B0T0_9BURK|nr:sigma-70 family RNA polymerase sigma factor [Pigmentiphaga aceris]QEI07484.1 sigma-70 family RNA polymerase sigma factor [Pigmentiphaga aceris]
MPRQPAPSALQALYCDHHGWLHGWLRQRLGNASDAADLAHDTFVRILGRDQHAAIREPRAYLATIANGLVVSHWRRRELEQAWLDTLAVHPQAVLPSAEDRAIILETLEQIARMLDGLPARCREIFLLSQIDGLTYPQISAQLGVSVNVVQKAMTRAVGHCFQILLRDD